MLHGCFVHPFVKWVNILTFLAYSLKLHWSIFLYYITQFFKMATSDINCVCELSLMRQNMNKRGPKAVKVVCLKILTNWTITFQSLNQKAWLLQRKQTCNDETQNPSQQFLTSTYSSCLLPLKFKTIKKITWRCILTTDWLEMSS